MIFLKMIIVLLLESPAFRLQEISSLLLLRHFIHLENKNKVKMS